MNNGKHATGARVHTSDKCVRIMFEREEKKERNKKKKARRELKKKEREEATKRKAGSS